MRSAAPEPSSPDGTLIAGRGLEAWKQLGWDEVPANVVNLDDIMRGELAENVERMSFLPSQVDALRRALLPIEQAAARERMSHGRQGWELSQPSVTTLRYSPDEVVHNEDDDCGNHRDEHAPQVEASYSRAAEIPEQVTADHASAHPEQG